jgi:hypothetical protein
MWVSLKKPYKIVGNKEKRYGEHYQIPASRCLIIPHERREEEVLCDVHWKEGDGIRALHNIMFDSENLELVNPMDNSDLFDLWVYFRPQSQNATGRDTFKAERSMVSRKQKDS